MADEEDGVDLPEFGELDGKRVRLTEVGRLNPTVAARVKVTLPNGDVIRPWRFVGSTDGVVVDDDGVLHM